MLCGYSPFRSEDPKEIVAETTRGHIEFQEKYWGKISQEGLSYSVTASVAGRSLTYTCYSCRFIAKDFILALLKVDPSERPTAEGALKLPVCVIFVFSELCSFRIYHRVTCSGLLHTHLLPSTIFRLVSGRTGAREKAGTAPSRRFALLAASTRWAKSAPTASRLGYQH